MRRGRGIIIGGMVLSLLIGCNNGIAEELAAEKRLGEIGRSAEKIFYSFIELVSGSLRFTVDATTTRDKVKEYFAGLANGVDKTIQALVEIGNKMQQPSGNEQKSVSVESSNQEIEGAKNTLKELKNHLEALKEIGDGNKVVEGNDTQNGASDGNALDKAHKALKGIVETAKTQNVDEPKKNDVATLQATQIGGTSPQEGARVLTTSNNAQSAAGPGAATIVSAVSGDDMLAAIVGSKAEDANTGVSGSADGQTSALAFAKGSNTATNLNQANAKAAAVAGGIALRSLTKGGKLASNSSNDGKAVQSAGITAVNKLLGAVEDIIKKTVKNVLEKAKQKIDEARSAKAKVQQ